MRKMTEAPEPKDKLDAVTLVAVSGPEDVTLDWRQVDWRQAERNVRRLRQRIFTASKAEDLARVRRLQKLMLRSRSNTLLSVSGSQPGRPDTQVVQRLIETAERRSSDSFVTA